MEERSKLINGTPIEYISFNNFNGYISCYPCSIDEHEDFSCAILVEIDGTITRFKIGLEDMEKFIRQMQRARYLSLGVKRRNTVPGAKDTKFAEKWKRHLDGFDTIEYDDLWGEDADIIVDEPETDGGDNGDETSV